MQIVHRSSEVSGFRARAKNLETTAAGVHRVEGIQALEGV
jgi:hypothetical protein